MTTPGNRLVETFRAVARRRAFRLTRDRLFTAVAIGTGFAGLAIGLAMPLPLQRAALVDLDGGAVIAAGLTPAQCRDLLASYPAEARRACL